ncbi:MAG TPA: 2-hydroxymuconate tautomerase [Desulfobacteraceae bacterium]|nr:2-hydroxymuconate tautomerase [Desulfobacteraceae bacterium]HPJ66728.1 2-hydroxymuconate tautomerase [Desulfobacteraceae bacterium]HPQ26911.1 2-hydroxymuconate tautomerase [Desulfobacteraceae bacterium]
MPIVHIYFLEGRTQEKKENLMKKVTEAICDTLDVEPERVRIILSEKTTDDISVGGVTLTKLRK